MTGTESPRTGDLPFRATDLIPLGRTGGVIKPLNAGPSPLEARPFGLRFATTTAAVAEVDTVGVCYDPTRQFTVDATGRPAFGKHSTGQTSTRTSDGYKSMDSDTDHTED